MLPARDKFSLKVPLNGVMLTLKKLVKTCEISSKAFAVWSSPRTQQHSTLHLKQQHSTLQLKQLAVVITWSVFRTTASRKYQSKSWFMRNTAHCAQKELYIIVITLFGNLDVAKLRNFLICLLLIFLFTLNSYYKKYSENIK